MDDKEKLYYALGTAVGEDLNHKSSASKRMLKKKLSKSTAFYELGSIRSNPDKIRQFEDLVSILLYWNHSSRMSLGQAIKKSEVSGNRINQLMSTRSTEVFIKYLLAICRISKSNDKKVMVNAGSLFIMIMNAYESRFNLDKIQRDILADYCS